MSNLSVKAFKDLQESKFTLGYKGTRDIEIQNAVVLFRNLAGVERVGKRKDGGTFKVASSEFKVAINEEVLQTLNNIGKFAISTMQVDEESGTLLYLLKVKVNMNSEWPPVVRLYTRGRDKNVKVNQLTPETIETADRVDIERCDIIIHPSEYDDGRFTMYLRTMNICTEESVEFGGYWDDLTDHPEMTFADQQ